MSTTKLRWGILGAAEIARKNWHAILNSGTGIVTAVASRELAKAKQFIADGQSQYPFAQAPEPVGSYEALLSRKDIDVGSSRVDLQACKLEYSIVSPK